MISEDDLLASSIHFDPALYTKRARKHQVYLIPRTGSILKGRLKGITLHNKKDKLFGKRIVVVEVPAVLVYDNRPEYEIQEFPIKDLSRESLRHRVLEAYQEELRRIRETSRRLD
jgi:hypothetical protein